MFTYCGNNPVNRYEMNGYVNWGGVMVGIGIGILAIGAAALTISTAGAAGPLAAAAISTIGTMASAALVETSVVTTVGAVCEEPVVYDVTVVGGHDRAGCSLVYDFGEDTTDFYLHTGSQTNSEIGVTFGSGFVFNYDKPGDYGGEFLDTSYSVNYKGASLGLDYCTSPSNLTNGYKDSHALLLTSGFGMPLLKHKGPTAAFDYYWSVDLF